MSYASPSKVARAARGRKVFRVHTAWWRLYQVLRFFKAKRLTSALLQKKRLKFRDYELNLPTGQVKVIRVGKLVTVPILNVKVVERDARATTK